MVYAYSQKEMFNSVIAREEGIVKMVDHIACEIISTGTVNVTSRDGTVLLAQRPFTLVLMMTNL